MTPLQELRSLFGCDVGPNVSACVSLQGTTITGVISLFLFFDPNVRGYFFLEVPPSFCGTPLVCYEIENRGLSFCCHQKMNSEICSERGLVASGKPLPRSIFLLRRSLIFNEKVPGIISGSFAITAETVISISASPPLCLFWGGWIPSFIPVFFILREILRQGSTFY